MQVCIFILARVNKRDIFPPNIKFLHNRLFITFWYSIGFNRRRTILSLSVFHFSVLKVAKCQCVFWVSSGFNRRKSISCTSIILELSSQNSLYFSVLKVAKCHNVFWVSGTRNFCFKPTCSKCLFLEIDFYCLNPIHFVFLEFSD